MIYRDYREFHQKFDHQKLEEQNLKILKQWLRGEAENESLRTWLTSFMG